MITLKLDKENIVHSELLSCLKNHVDSIAEYFFNFSEKIVLEEETSRNYTPMDRCYPPNCPFSDYNGYNANVNGYQIRISGTKTMWNPNEMSNQGVTFSIHNSKNEMIAYFSAYSDSRIFEKITLKSKILDNVALRRIAKYLEVVLYFPH